MRWQKCKKLHKECYTMLCCSFWKKYSLSTGLLRVPTATGTKSNNSCDEACFVFVSRLSQIFDNLFIMAWFVSKLSKSLLLHKLALAKLFTAKLTCGRCWYPIDLFRMLTVSECSVLEALCEVCSRMYLLFCFECKCFAWWWVFYYYYGLKLCSLLMRII